MDSISSFPNHRLYFHKKIVDIKITPNKNWRVKSIYTYKPGATKMKKVKGSSVTIPTNCRAFITMENKKNKLTEKVTFDEMDTTEDPGFTF